MAVCTFFGHHDCPASVKEELRETIRDLIENCGVSMFYVGNHGTFDAIVRSTLGCRMTVFHFSGVTFLASDI